MEENKKIPGIVQLGAWLLSLIVFAVGFWHTHLGLKQMNVFDSEYGSIAIAAIVLILILITYWFAVNGNKTALIFYIICGLFVFVFNLNYFYPSYMGRNLVNEEAKNINDTLQSYANKAAVLGGGGEDYKKVNILRDLIPSILGEIKNLNGKGRVTQEKIDRFNSICKELGVDIFINVSGGVGNSQAEKDKIASQLERDLNNALNTVVTNAIQAKNAGMVVEGSDKLRNLQTDYKQVLENIQLDKSNIKLDSVKTHPQINSLISLVKGINEATSLINKGSDIKKYEIIDEEKTPYTKYLGQIENTMVTVGQRIDKISTWAIILVCLFIDLLVPLAIYLLLRKKEGDDDDDSSLASGPREF